MEERNVCDCIKVFDNYFKRNDKSIYYDDCFKQLDLHNETHQKHYDRDFICFYHECDKEFGSEEEWKQHFLDHKKDKNGVIFTTIKGKKYSLPKLDLYLEKNY